MALSIVGIAGGTASGKTTIAELIQNNPKLSGHTELIRLDDYYLDRSDIPISARESINYDHPKSFDIDLLIEHLEKLKNGLSINKPIYDFGMHIRKSESVIISPKDIIIVEGILVFAFDSLCKMMDYKIYVDTPDDIRLIRRIERDMKERGRDLHSIINQYRSTVRPMHTLFVEPSKSKADLIIPEGGQNHIAIEMVISALQAIL